MAKTAKTPYRATKATLKRLCSLACTLYGDDCEICSMLAKAAKQANDAEWNLAQCAKYDPKDLVDCERRLLASGRAYYCGNDTLLIKPRPFQVSLAFGLQIKYPELVRFTHTHDINNLEILDINKLTRLIQAEKEQAA